MCGSERSWARCGWLWLGLWWLSCWQLPAHSDAADGISNSLMNVPSATIVAPGTIEFSPTLQIGWVGEDFSKDIREPGIPRQRPFYDSQSNVRLTFGVTSWLEFGLQLPLLAQWEGTNATFVIERLGLATKVQLYESPGQMFRVALFGGIQTPLMARSWTSHTGPVVDLQPTSWLLFNISACATLDWLQTVTPGFHYDVGAGIFFVPERLQFVVEWSHVWVFGNGSTTSTTTEGSLGVAVNWYVNPAVTLLVGGLFDLFGVSQPRNIQAILSLAVVFDGRAKPQASLR